MAPLFSLLTLLISSILPSSINALNPSPRKQDLVAATQEMQEAKYYTFVMLINMSPPDPRLESNVTFLLPDDKTLANSVISHSDLPQFLLRHSIPSPLLYDNLEHIPTGTVFPSSLPEYVIMVSNNGRKNFSLNNVKLISPNICVAGSSIRCHGIDGVLLEANGPRNDSCTSPPSPSPSPSLGPGPSPCDNRSSPPHSPDPPPAPLPPPMVPPSEHLTPAPAASPSPNNQSGQTSGSSTSLWILSNEGLMKLLLTSLTMSTLLVYL